MLWLIIATGAILILARIGVYHYVDNLSITRYVFGVTAGNFIISQVKMLFNFAKFLGIVFSLTGIAVIILTLDRFSFTRAAHRMASVTRKDILYF